MFLIRAIGFGWWLLGMAVGKKSGC